MKKVLLTALVAATLGIALPIAAQNIAIVNGKPVPRARVDMLQQQLAKAGRPVSVQMQDQLKDEVLRLKKEQFNMRFQKATGQIDNTSRIRQIRRDIARLKTVESQQAQAK